MNTLAIALSTAGAFIVGFKAFIYTVNPGQRVTTPSFSHSSSTIYQDSSKMYMGQATNGGSP